MFDPKNVPNAERVLRDIEGLTAPEVATALHLTIETVKSRLHRARHMLRGRLVQWRE